MTAATLPRLAQPSSSRLSLFSVLGWLFLGLAITTLIDFDWTQDIAAYAENLEAQPDYDLDTLKGVWYQFLVFPVMDVMGSSDATLAALKGIIFSLFFFSQRKAFNSHLDCLLFLVVLLLTPALAKNMTEYLRQGTALGILMVGLSFSRWFITIPLAVVSLFTHLAVVLPVMASIGSWVLGLFTAKRRALLSFLTPLVFPGLALIFGLMGGDVIRAFAPDEAQDYLSGSRANILGLLYLALLAFYTGVRYSVFGSKAHLPVFLMFLVITANYSVLLNFGRTISIVLPFHLAAALTLPTARARYIDLLAVFVGGTAFAFAGSAA